jgi:hypothetical protein
VIATPIIPYLLIRKYENNSVLKKEINVTEKYVSVFLLTTISLLKCIQMIPKKLFPNNKI